MTEQIGGHGAGALNRPWVRAAAFAAAGLIAGGVLAGTLSATAADSDTTGTAAYSTTPAQPAAPPGGMDESQPQRPDEKLLTGEVAAKVRAAALAKYPGASIQRVETDSDGIYEAHLVTAAGERVTVEVGKDFAVTGNETRRREDEGAADSQPTA